ncbi:MAG: stage III sporulation protein AF [Anaerobutyricum sp.]|nr:stage III sporulation protein AF [Eubacterium sp.]MDY6045636.1 stage III sporulation protein AF [Anaerobutyricum sp.]
MVDLEYLKEWLKTILYMNVLLLIFDSLVQTTKYEKYFRFFSGFLMMLCLLKPLVDLSGANGYMDASYIQNELKNELRLIGKSEDLKGMKKEIREEYDRAIENQISEMAAACNIEIKDVKIQWEEETNQMKKLRIKGKSSGENEKSPNLHSFRETLKQFYNLDSENLIIEIQE